MKRTAISTCATNVLLLGALSLGACDDSDGPPGEEGPVSMADLGLEGQSYDDAVPQEFQSVIRPADANDIADMADLKRELAVTDEAGEGNDAEVVPPTAVIEASATRAMFPMPRGKRTFETHAEVVGFVAEHFGSAELIHDEETGEVVGARGAYLQRGTSFFEDEGLGAKFKVTDPVLAFLGGVRGEIEVGGEVWCVDPDGECDNERASYLNPVGDVTALTHDPECGSRGVCVEFHSFYNRTWFPIPWARHGSNVRFTTYGALPSTRLSARGAIHVPPGAFLSAFWTTFPLPLASNQGQDSVETAVWCFGTESCVEYQSTAVCGTGTVADIDINRTRRTGNGPANNARCPG